MECAADEYWEEISVLIDVESLRIQKRLLMTALSNERLCMQKFCTYPQACNYRECLKNAIEEVRLRSHLVDVLSL